MTTTVTIRERFKLIHKRNPVSGHEWFDHGPTTGYDIVGQFGVVESCRSKERAEVLRKEWQEYYDKHTEN